MVGHIGRTRRIVRSIVLVCLAAACAAPPPTAPPPPATLSKLEWITLQPLFADQDSLVGFTTSSGSLDVERGPSTERLFDPLTPSIRYARATPWISGGHANPIMVGAWDGTTTEILNARSPSSPLVSWGRAPFVVEHAVRDQDGRTYLVAVDPATRKDLGILVVEPGADLDTARRLVQLPPTDGADPTSRRVRLMMSPAGAFLIERVCEGGLCTFTVMDADDGRVVQSHRDVSESDVLAVTDQEVIVVGDCEAPCPAVALDLVRPAANAIGAVCSSGAVTRQDDGFAFAFDGESGSCDSRALGALSLSTGQRIGSYPIGASMDIASDRPDQVIDVQAGWVVLAPDGRLGSEEGDQGVVVRLADGESVQLE